MIDFNIKFKKLIIEIEKLLLEKVLTVKARILILGKQDYYDMQEMKKNNAELERLKNMYSQICRELMKLDKVKANLGIKKIIKMKKELDENFIRDMKNALKGDDPAFWFGH